MTKDTFIAQVSANVSLAAHVLGGAGHEQEFHGYLLEKQTVEGDGAVVITLLSAYPHDDGTRHRIHISTHRKG